MFGSNDRLAVPRAARRHAPQTGSAVRLTTRERRNESGDQSKEERKVKDRSTNAKSPLESGGKHAEHCDVLPDILDASG